jgi:hypothetical protein
MKTLSRFTIPALAALTLGGVAILAAAPRATGEEAAPAVRTFKFTYTAKIPKPADGSKRLDAWIPLPVEDDLQKVADLKSSVKTGDGGDLKGEVTKDEQYGNSMLHAGVDDPKSDVILSWSATITRTEDRGQGTGPMNDRFKQADKLVPIDGKASEIAKSIGVDAAGDARQEGLRRSPLDDGLRQEDARIRQRRLQSRVRGRQGQLHRLPREVHRHRARRGHPRPLHDGHPDEARCEGRRGRLPLLGSFL